MDGSRPSYDPVKFPHRYLTECVIGCFDDVYNEIGFGFLESVYHRAMAVALESMGLRVESEAKLPVYFRGVQVGHFEADLLVEGVVILEFKAVEELITGHMAQLLNYLKASTVELGLLLNFGPDPLIRRLAFANDRKRSRLPISVD
jgi:GxxExxY protein